jgi:hypothetical protein
MTDRTHLGYHLEALSKTSTPEWLWKTALTGPLNGKGAIDPFAEYGAFSFNISGDNDIFLLYRGEFWRGGDQANQIFHYKGDGTFAGQFGTPSVDGTLANAPGEAQNMSTVSPYKVGSKIYVYA